MLTTRSLAPAATLERLHAASPISAEPRSTITGWRWSASGERIAAVHKGASKKTAITAADLQEIVDCYFRIQRIMGGLNHVSEQKLPLMAATATLKACWSELSGATAGVGWSFPATYVTADGLAPQAKRSAEPQEEIDMRRTWRSRERDQG